MNLSTDLIKRYTAEKLSAREAQRLAEFIAWGPAIFQVSRLMVKFGILDLLRDSRDGLTRQDLVEHTSLSDYAMKCLLEASLSIGIVFGESSDRKIYDLENRVVFTERPCYSSEYGLQPRCELRRLVPS